MTSFVSLLVVAALALVDVVGGKLRFLEGSRIAPGSRWRAASPSLTSSPIFCLISARRRRLSRRLLSREGTGLGRR